MRLDGDQAVTAALVYGTLTFLLGYWQGRRSTKLLEDAAIKKTIWDLRWYMAAATVKNPLHMIDDFEAKYPEYLEHERLQDRRARWEHDEG